MPAQARHIAGLVLARRGYRVVAGGPVVWHTTRPRRAAHGAAGGWSGYFVIDSFPDTVFDLTEWVDRDHDPAIVRYAYQARYCNSLYGGVRWQYRFDLHPVHEPTSFVPHSHDHAVREGEHDPRPFSRSLDLAEALSLLEQHVATRIGPCSAQVPGVRSRAPHQPGTGHLTVEPQQG